MSEPTQADPIAELAEQWRRWTRIVHLFASRHDRRHAIDSNQYQAMHADLMNRCRTTTRAGDLLEIVEPWVSLDSLARADRQIVCQLSDRCRRTLRGLDSAASVRTLPDWARQAVWIAGLAALAGAVVLTLYNSGPLCSSIVATSKSWFHTACNTVARNQHQQELVLGGFLALAATMAVVWRAAGRN